MAYKIAIASGKGGTGKTTVAVNLFHQLAKKGVQTLLVDCDVEEPNAGLFLNDKQERFSEKVCQWIPEIDENQCTFCGRCQDWCEFNAIVIIPSKQFVQVDESLCHSCGACSVACKDNAIKEKASEIGCISVYDTGFGEGLYEGRLKVGSSMQTMMIKELKKSLKGKADIIIFDSPPGTSCQVVETVSDCDYVVLVAEPTPFGLHDLKLMVVLLQQMKKSFGVVINKAGLGDDKIYAFLKKEGIETLSEIPFDRSFASNYAKGDFLNDQASEIQSAIHILAEQVETKTACGKLQY